MVVRTLLCTGIFLASVASAFGGDSSNLLAQQRQQTLAGIKSKPLMKEQRINDVFLLVRDGDDLTLQPVMTPLRYYEEQRAELKELPYPATVLCRELSHDIPDQIEFEFTAQEWPNEMDHVVYQVQSRPSELQIGCTWFMPTGDRSILLMRMNGMVTLRLSSREESGASAVVDINEPSYSAFYRKHFELLDRYVLPILRHLRQESAMAPESEAAWQVLAGDLPVEPTIMQQVQAQLPLLDSAEFHQRALAMRTLRKLGKPGALSLMHVNRSTLSCEQTARIDEVLSRFTAFPDETSSRLHENADFLIDCLYCQDATLSKLAIARLERLTGRTLSFDATLEDQPRIAAVNALRDSLMKQPAKAEKK